MTCDETRMRISATGGVTNSWPGGITTVSSIADLNINPTGTECVTLIDFGGWSERNDKRIT